MALLGADEVARARRRGVPVEGLCLYPVMNHPGWDDDRVCENGLLNQQFDGVQRGVDPLLAMAVRQAVVDFAKRGSIRRNKRAYGQTVVV